MSPADLIQFATWNKRDLKATFRQSRLATWDHVSLIGFLGADFQHHLP